MARALFHVKSPDMQPAVGDKHFVNGQFLLIKELPENEGDPVVLSLQGGNFQDYDYYPEVIGLEWRSLA